MTTVSPNAISEKLMDSPELAKLIGELSTSTDDANELVKGLLQASINAGFAGGDGCPFGLRALRPQSESPGRECWW